MQPFYMRQALKTPQIRGFRSVGRVKPLLFQSLIASRENPVRLTRLHSSFQMKTAISLMPFGGNPQSTRRGGRNPLMLWSIIPLRASGPKNQSLV